MRKTSELESVISKNDDFKSLYYHYDERVLKELIQPAYLKMLLDFDTICKENDIRYNITAGTLLGAVREKGFIPWDDDVDINVTSDDYKRIKKAITNSGFEHLYDFIVPEESDVVTVDGKFISKTVSYGTLLNDPGIGNKIYMDVLAIENVPDNKLLREIKAFFSSLLIISHNSLRCYKRYDPLLNIMAKTNKTLKKNLVIRKIVGIPAFVLGKRNTFLLLQKVNHYGKNDSKYVSVPLGVKRYKGEMILRTDFFKTVPIEFEGHILQAPIGFHTYLNNRYGSNYMEKPPVEEQGIKCFQRREDWDDILND